MHCMANGFAEFLTGRLRRARILDGWLTDIGGRVSHAFWMVRRQCGALLSAGMGLVCGLRPKSQIDQFLDTEVCWEGWPAIVRRRNAAPIRMGS